MDENESKLTPAVAAYFDERIAVIERSIAEREKLAVRFRESGYNLVKDSKHKVLSNHDLDKAKQCEDIAAGMRAALNIILGR